MARQSFDLVITDIKMSGMDGIQLLTEIKKVYRDTKVIIMTAYGSDELRRISSSKGAIHYIEKPFDVEELRDLILNVLQKESRGFKGSISDIDLVDIIQMLCMTNATKLITVTYPSQKGEGYIYVQNGHIIHAEYKKTQGEDAFLRILGSESGTFSIRTTDIMPGRTITKTWNNLILTTLQQLDERGIFEEDELEEETDTVSDIPQDVLDTMREYLAWVPISLGEGYMSNFLIDSEKRIIAHLRDPVFQDELEAWWQKSISFIDTVVEPVYEGKTFDIAENCQCVLHNLNNGLWHGTIVPPGSDLVDLNHVVERIKDEIVDVLKKEVQ